MKSISYLHIGKTGGNSIKNYLSQLGESAQDNFTVYPHKTKLNEMLQQNKSAQIAFVFREPTKRFISGFNSRLRCGRPKNNSRWSVEEAIAFQYFTTPKSLANALIGKDERLYSAAQFAMSSISHLARNYEYYFGNIDRLNNIREKIIFACDLEKLNDKYIGLFSQVIDEPANGWPRLKKLHSTVHDDEPLNPEEKQALKQYWKRDYEIYNWLLENFD